MKRRLLCGRAEISILIYGIIAIMCWPWNSVTCNRRQQSTRLYQLMSERGSCLCSDVTALSAHPLPADSQSVVLLAHYHLLGRRAADPCNLQSMQFLVWNRRDCDKTGCTIHAFLRGLKDVASCSFDEVLESEYLKYRLTTYTRSQTIFKVINFESFVYIYYTLASLQLVIIYNKTVTYIHQLHNL